MKRLLATSLFAAGAYSLNSELVAATGVTTAPDAAALSTWMTLEHVSLGVIQH